MSNKVEKAKDDLIEQLDEVSREDRMTRAEYKELLEELLSELEVRYDAVKDESGEDEG